jgi:nucleoside-diphosphate-sugar epimerase
MNYLIFGGEGFIGKHLAQYLVKELQVPQKDIYSYDIRTTDKSANYTHLDVRKRIDLSIPNVQDSIIFNLAAVHTTPGHPDYEYFETNIRGAENVCDFAERSGINKIVFTSSIAPYGASEDYKTEGTLPLPNTPYGISKLTAEYIHKTWQAKDFQIRKLSIVRPGVVFGLHEGGNFTRLYSAMSKNYFFYPGRKDTVKACVYVKDVVRIIYESVTSHPERKNVDTFNLTYDPAPTLEEICTTISKVTNVANPRVLVPSWILRSTATVIYTSGLLIGKKFKGIHPARVRKLMISTNISGDKLHQSPYKLKYSLEEAVRDWFNDCDKTGLY